MNTIPPNTVSLWRLLPNELVYDIFSYLSPKQRKAVERLNKTSRFLITELNKKGVDQSALKEIDRLIRYKLAGNQGYVKQTYKNIQREEDEISSDLFSAWLLPPGWHDVGDIARRQKDSRKMNLYLYKKDDSTVQNNKGRYLLSWVANDKYIAVYKLKCLEKTIKLKFDGMKKSYLIDCEVSKSWNIENMLLHLNLQCHQISEDFSNLGYLAKVANFIKSIIE